jgi:hypothetical protein
MERVELLRATVIDAGAGGRVCAELQGDELFLFEAVLGQACQCLLVVTNVDAKQPSGANSSTNALAVWSV